MNQQVHFEPKYDWLFWAGFGVIGVGAVVCLFMAATSGWPPDLLTAAAAAILTALLLRVLAINPRSISFGRHIEIRRFILPPKQIDYTDIRDLGFEKIKTRKGPIRTFAMSNAEELYTAFDTAIESGLIQEAQLEDRLAYHELAMLNAYSVVALVLLAGGLILRVTGYVEYLWVNVTLAVGVAAGAAVYLYSRRRFQNQPAEPTAA